MKTSEILDLNCMDEDNVEIIQNVLSKIGPLKKYSSKKKIPLNKLEKYVELCCRNKMLSLQYIMTSYLSGESRWYSCSIKRDDTHEWLGNVYGYTIYEVFAKLCIKMYSDMKNLDIPDREDEE